MVAPQITQIFPIFLISNGAWDGETSRILHLLRQSSLDYGTIAFRQAHGPALHLSFVTHYLLHNRRKIGHLRQSFYQCNVCLQFLENTQRFVELLIKGCLLQSLREGDRGFIDRDFPFLYFFCICIFFALVFSLPSFRLLLFPAQFVTFLVSELFSFALIWSFLLSFISFDIPCLLCNWSF